MMKIQNKSRRDALRFGTLAFFWPLTGCGGGGSSEDSVAAAPQAPTTAAPPAAPNVPVPTTLGATNQRTGVFYPNNIGIQDAIYYAGANDTILVNPGTYTRPNDYLYLNKSLTVRSATPGVKYD